MQSTDNIIIERYGLRVRLATVDDAEFILALRTDPRLSRHISPTKPDISVQRDWLQRYKEREAIGKEYYFIIQHKERPIGTFRLYDISGDSFVSGSWVFSPDSPAGASILGEIICKEFAYENLGLKHNHGDVRKDNRQVLRYNLSYNPTITGEDDENVYLEFDKESFYREKEKHIKLCMRVMNAVLP